ncbi:MAG: thiamine phosphate synthase [Rhodospirillales bacterium]
MAQPRCRLYLITPPRIDDLTAFADLMGRTLDAGDVACVQLRLKDVDDDTIRRAAEVLAPVIQGRDVALIVNDRPDLAAETGADGVHIGQDDGDYAAARAAVGADAIVGVTCHASRDLAMQAGDAGADYVAFGAFYPTETKEAPSRAEPEILEIWSTMTTVPCVAIGGITVDNAAPLVKAGADFLAVSAGLWRHPEGAEAACRAFNALIEKEGSISQ